MKKLAAIAAAAFAAFAFAGCSSDSSSTSSNSDADSTTITVGATSTPHAEILEEAKPLLADKGYELEIVEFSDYPNINPSTSDGSLDANYFQHQPYLDGYNEDSGYSSGDDGYLVSAGAIHYEPLGIYSKTVTADTLKDLKDGATVIVPNDATNEARALVLLQDNGLITLKEGSGETATVADIESNPKNLKIVEIDAAQVPTRLDDADIIVANGNYALAADISDNLVVNESADSDAAKTYQNIIAVKESNKDDPAVVALVEVLKSDDIKNFITEKYGVSVVPAQ